jgi:hypothetical protein
LAKNNRKKKKKRPSLFEEDVSLYEEEPLLMVGKDSLLLENICYMLVID